MPELSFHQEEAGCTIHRPVALAVSTQRHSGARAHPESRPAHVLCPFMAEDEESVRIYTWRNKIEC